MEKLLAWLRGLGKAGGFIAAVLQFIAAYFGLTVSAVVGAIVAYSETLSGWASNPRVYVFAGVFLFVLWSYIGIQFLRDRKKPREVIPAQDYRYGLTFGGLVPNYTPEEEDALGIGIQLVNFSSGPIRYDITNVEIRIGTRSIRLKKGVLYSYMPRGGQKLSTPTPFKSADIKEFIGKGRMTATMEFSITYGHPERPPARQLDVKSQEIVPAETDSAHGWLAGQ